MNDEWKIKMCKRSWLTHNWKLKLKGFIQVTVLTHSFMQISPADGLYTSISDST